MTYINYLAEKSRLSKLPRTADMPTVISTFAGGGGSLTGYLMAGYQDLLAVEFDKKAVDTLVTNYPNLNVFHGDINELTIGEVLLTTNLNVGELDILDGSPPCQGFSILGTRNLLDPRNQLYIEYIRLINGLMPKVCILENVASISHGKMKVYLNDIVQRITELGYDVSAKVLNAKYFHVPQSRSRLILIGVRTDLNKKATHPKPESRPYTVKQAWENIIQDSESISIAYDIQSENEKTIWPHISSSMNSAERKVAMQQVIGISGGYIGYQKVDEHRPCPCITKTEGGKGGLHHYLESRRLTIQELKRVASFPDDYKFANREIAISQIGNSVPPLFMEAIARHCKEIYL